ncbi:serine/threonine protein kinase [Fonticula alba]|uniref:Serine/threonine protein kinase n=1 Tax=Fonticula alba TaxID=691883 RepID=A0A058Z7P6_FONAL|nr:serine/threonine protein kinase [Fonticula alba]KCV70319.1 serine/threonine protein kinase [Fonticula alba]|eukprot:XP_009494835.1 serine/threonine protein kinase [Fonticula alba]
MTSGCSGPPSRAALGCLLLVVLLQTARSALRPMPYDLVSCASDKNEHYILDDFNNLLLNITLKLDAFDDGPPPVRVCMDPAIQVVLRSNSDGLNCFLHTDYKPTDEPSSCNASDEANPDITPKYHNLTLPADFCHSAGECKFFVRCPNFYGPMTYFRTPAVLMRGDVCRDENMVCGAESHECECLPHFTEHQGVCIRNRCPAFDHRERHIAFEATDSLETAVGKCDPGFHGNIVLACRADGTWEPMTRGCTDIICPAQCREHICWEQAVAGDTVRADCGPLHEGDLLLECSEEDQWQELPGPGCVRRQCPEVEVLGLRFLETPTLESLALRCPVGFTGDFRLDCRADKTWAAPRPVAGLGDGPAHAWRWEAPSASPEPAEEDLLNEAALLALCQLDLARTSTPHMATFQLEPLAHDTLQARWRLPEGAAARLAPLAPGLEVRRHIPGTLTFATVAVLHSGPGALPEVGRYNVTGLPALQEDLYQLVLSYNDPDAQVGPSGDRPGRALARRLPAAPGDEAPGGGPAGTSASDSTHGHGSAASGSASPTEATPRMPIPRLEEGLLLQRRTLPRPPGPRYTVELAADEVLLLRWDPSPDADQYLVVLEPLPEGGPAAGLAAAREDTPPGPAVGETFIREEPRLSLNATLYRGGAFRAQVFSGSLLVADTWERTGLLFDFTVGQVPGRSGGALLPVLVALAGGLAMVAAAAGLAVSAAGRRRRARHVAAAAAAAATATALADGAAQYQACLRQGALPGEKMPDVSWLAADAEGALGTGALGPGQLDTVLNTFETISVPGFLEMVATGEARQLELLDRVGKGATGMVLRARLLDPEIVRRVGSELVAAKRMAPQGTAGGGGPLAAGPGAALPPAAPGSRWWAFSQQRRRQEKYLTQRFRQEIAIMWSLSFNSNIVPLVGYTTDPPMIVTHLYDTDMYRYLHRSPAHLAAAEAIRAAGPDGPAPPAPIIPRLPVGEILHHARCLAGAVAGMHFLGIAHRDIKSANVLLRQPVPRPGQAPPAAAYLEPAFCDFGLARTTASSATDMVLVAGFSPRYAAPEVFSRSYAQSGGGQWPFEQDLQSDVYALGVLFYEIISRQLPWGPLNYQEIEQLVRSGERLALLDVEEEGLFDKPEPMLRLRDVVERCLATEPEHRPTADQVAKLVAQIADAPSP